MRSYSELIWQQFKKNKLAHISVYVVVFFYLIAICCPLISSGQPFYFSSPASDEIEFPWFRALFHTDTTVDLFFNMLLLTLPLPLLLIVLRGGFLPKIFAAHFVVGVILTVIFSFESARPANKYFRRVFRVEAARDGARYLFPILPFSPSENDLDSTFKPPFYRKAGKALRYGDDNIHVLGTDSTGRDVLTRMLYGTRVALTIGFLSVIISASIGVVIGSVAGYFGGKTDVVLCRLIEIVVLFPGFFLLIVVVAMLKGSADRLFVVMMVLGAIGWTGVARLVRGEFLKQRSMDYVEAARALGISRARIIFRHILPNAVSPVLVSIPFGIGGAVIVEVSLSFLGYGVVPPTPSWGEILRQAYEHYHLWWLAVFPGLAVFVLVTCFNLIGQGFRDSIDPKLRV